MAVSLSASYVTWMTENEKPTVDGILLKLHGATLVSAEAWEFGWTFSFANGASLTTQSIWRVMTASGIAVTSEDHCQQFGLPEPIDAGKRAVSVLIGQINGTILAPITSDLRLNFGSETVLEFLNTSCGYEGWHLVACEGERSWEMVALGGGEVAMWSSIRGNEDRT